MKMINNRLLENPHEILASERSKERLAFASKRNDSCAGHKTEKNIKTNEPMRST